MSLILDKRGTPKDHIKSDRKTNKKENESDKHEFRKLNTSGTTCHCTMSQDILSSELYS